MLTTFPSMQQSSFFIVLTANKDNFNGRLQCTYDRAFRLSGCWEVALLNLSKSDDAVYVFCDLVDYSHVNNNKVQLLDYYTENHQPEYVKVLYKRFNTINVDIRKTLEDYDYTSKEDIVCMLHFRKCT